MCVCTWGGCEAAVTAGTRCGWCECGECGDSLHGVKIRLKLNGTVYERCVSLCLVMSVLYSMITQHKLLAFYSGDRLSLRNRYGIATRMRTSCSRYLVRFCFFAFPLQKGLKNVFDEAILAALEPPKQSKKKRRCVML